MKKNERLSVVRAFSKQYCRASKKGKSDLLSKVSAATGYSRKHLMEILPKPPKKKVIKRKRASKYLVILKPLRKLWAVSNYACGQRLAPMIPTYLEALKRHQELKVIQKEKKLLCKISSSSVDRLLIHDRRRINLKGRSRTKPGTLLKHQIPIKTWADWSDTSPGFLEIDSVHHCGDSNRGDYLYTLDTTDVSTGWNECYAHMGKSERYTVEALETIRKRLPFSLKGIDFDSGGEFVNYHLIRYCTRHEITYTRAREAVKNDQPYIEQQNYSVVRRFVGYGRLDSWEQLEILNKLYEKLSDYQNFFQPVMKLKDKVRDGAKVTRRYAKAQTAYQRLLEREDIPADAKRQLTERFLKINPQRVLLEVTALAKKLSRC